MKKQQKTTALQLMLTGKLEDYLLYLHRLSLENSAK